MKSLHAKDPKRYAIEALCRLFGKSKQAYHKYDEDKALAKAARVDFAIQFVHATREEDHGIGGQLLYVMYKKELGPTGDSLGRDVFYRILDEYGLKLRQKLRGTRTTDSTHGLPTYPNLVKDFIPNGSNQLWVSDITYIRIWLDEHTYVFCYLSLILDAYSEEIVGWSVGPDLSTKYPLEALKMALKRLDGVPSEDIYLIHHADRGVQYASAEYVKILLEHNININSLQSQVFISPNAISANNGLTDLYIDKNIEDQNWTSVSSIITDGWQSKIEMESIKVNAITLDKAIENCYKSPDIIKIDVEGAEYKIIEKSKLINQATYLIIELQPIAKRSRQESIKKIRRILSKKGFLIEDVRLDDEELSVIIAKIIS